MDIGRILFEWTLYIYLKILMAGTDALGTITTTQWEIV